MKRKLVDFVGSLAPELFPTGLFFITIGLSLIPLVVSSSDVKGNIMPMMVIDIILGFIFVVVGVGSQNNVNKKERSKINIEKEKDKEDSVERHKQVLAALEKQVKEISGLKEDFKAIGEQIEELKKDIDDKNNREFK